MPLVVNERFGDPRLASYIWSAQAVFELLFMTLAGYWAAKYGSKRIIVLSSVCALVTYLTYATVDYLPVFLSFNLFTLFRFRSAWGCHGVRAENVSSSYGIRGKLICIHNADGFVDRVHASGLNRRDNAEHLLHSFGARPCLAFHYDPRNAQRKITLTNILLGVYLDQEIPTRGIKVEKLK